MAEGTSFAIATQQAHKVGKSPKRFRTSEGVATAKAKMSRPVKEYRKTAGVSDIAIPIAAGTAMGAGALGGILLSVGPKGRERMKGERRDARLHSNLRNLLKSREERVAAHKKLKRYKHKTVGEAFRHGWSQGEKTAELAGFFDELEKTAGLAQVAERVIGEVLKTPARRFLTGALLGAALWGALPSRKKEEIKEQAGGEQKMPPIIILPQQKQRDVVAEELAKADPDFRGIGRGLLKHSTVGMTPLPKPQATTSFAQKQFNQSRRIGTSKAARPPDPNIRAVASVPR